MHFLCSISIPFVGAFTASIVHRPPLSADFFSGPVNVFNDFFEAFAAERHVVTLTRNLKSILLIT